MNISSKSYDALSYLLPFTYGGPGDNNEVLTRTLNILGKRADFEAGKPPKERLGGVLAVQIFDIKNPERSNGASITIGNPGFDLPKKALLAHEKIRRLELNRNDEHGPAHWLASESANPAKDQYGGAVVGILEDSTQMYIAYSGAPTVVDEALCIALTKDFDLEIPKELYQGKWFKRLVATMNANRSSMGDISAHINEIDYDLVDKRP